MSQPQLEEQDNGPDELIVTTGATNLYEVSLSYDRLMADVFVEHDRLSRLLVLAAGELPESESWFQVVEWMMLSLGYERLRKENTCNHETDLDAGFVYDVYGADPEGDWLHRSELNDDGYVPGAGHSPMWADGVLSELDEEDSETLPKVVVFVFPHHGVDPRNGYGSPVVGHFEGDYTYPVDLSVQWYLEACDEDHDEAVEFAKKANDDCALSARAATSHLEGMVKIVEDGDGEPVPYNVEKNAFEVVTKTGLRLWAYPGRHYFGQ